MSRLTCLLRAASILTSRSTVHLSIRPLIISGIRFARFAVDISNTGYWYPPRLSSKNTGIADWLTC